MEQYRNELFHIVLESLLEESHPNGLKGLVDHFKTRSIGGLKYTSHKEGSERQTSLAIAGCYLSLAPRPKGMKIIVCYSPKSPVSSKMFSSNIYPDYHLSLEVDQIIKDANSRIQKIQSKPEGVAPGRFTLMLNSLSLGKGQVWIEYRSL
ncbi:hypothetical protein KSP39_PZI009329 [Platanthera zijinensis]|uniref:Uncharacterized protein n=1 Tax=Platanthera zijinensis TaxID=2320716 RepID=A0AAP0BJX5_9ASPA